MEKLNISYEEAEQLIKDDAIIDKMTSAKEINNDLTSEQIKNIKTAKKADRKPTSYKFDSSKRKKKTNEDKKQIIAELVEAVEKMGAVCDITNDEREFTFTIDEKNYRLTLAEPRTKKS